MTQALAQTDANTIRKAIADAEKGEATLGQLCGAHDMAEKAGATKTLGVLRSHIHRMTPQPLFHSELKSILLGMISGILTWSLLGRRPSAR